MIKSGKCPKCETVIQRVNLEHIEVGVPFSGPTYAGVSYVCPACKAILGVGIDPVAVKRDTIDGVIQALREEGKRR